MTRFPNLKILLHLMGAIIPFFDARIETRGGRHSAAGRPARTVVSERIIYGSCLG
jgi:hypothetical protein